MAATTPARRSRSVLSSAIQAVDTSLRWLDVHPWAAFAAMAAAAYVGLFYLGRHGTFFQDEWAFIEGDPLSAPTDWLAPHNEHWSTLPRILYRVLLLTFGLRTHLPYLAVLLLLHVAAASALFVLLRRTSGSLVALAGGGLFLVLGSAYQNLFWAFQIGFVGSCAAGLWALVMLERRDRVGAGAGLLLLLAAVMSSAPGLAFLGLAGVEVLLDSRRRWMTLWLVPVAIAFGGWFLLFGRSGLADNGPLGASTLLGIPRFVLSGAIGGINGLVGLGSVVALALLLSAVVAALLLLARRQLPSRAVSAAAGLAVLFGLIAIGREQDPDPGGIPRYVYESSIFVLLGASALVGRAADVLGAARQTWSRGAPGTVLLLGGIVVFTVTGLVHNQALLRSGAVFFNDKAGELRAYVDAGGQPSAFPFDPPAAAVPLRMPVPSRLIDLIERYGSPATDALWPSVAIRPTAAQSDRAFWRLAGGGLTAAPALEPVGRSAPKIASFAGTSLQVVDGCVEANANGEIVVSIVLSPGGTLEILAGQTGTGIARLGRQATPQPIDAIALSLTAGSWTALRVPTVAGFDYEVALALPGGAAARLCAVPGG
jgi:hypothetical protein